MALACARCGAQNPDGNAFCQACGTPLAAGPVATALPFPPPGAVPPPPPVAYASPPPTPMGYQSPYYSPGPGGVQPPVHRTPWVVIISAVVALILIMAGAGTAIAIIGARSNNAGTNGLEGQLPTPSPAGSPSPVGSPTPLQTGPSASNDGLTIPVPSGWSVSAKDNESITLVNPNGDGSVTAGSGASLPPMSAQANKDQIDKYFASKYPDTKNCPGTATTTGSLNGAPGIFWTLCFTLTQGGQSFQAAAALFAGANSSGSVYYVVMEVTSQDNLQTLIADSKPILQGIQWKLT
jgi:zinc ribbon protein